MTMDILGWRELWSNVSPLMVVLKKLSYILEVCYFFFRRWWNYCTFQQERDNFSTFPHPRRFPVVILLLPLPQRKETRLQHWIQSKAKENCKNPTLTQIAMKRQKETPGRYKKRRLIWLKERWIWTVSCSSDLGKHISTPLSIEWKLVHSLLFSLVTSLPPPSAGPFY